MACQCTQTCWPGRNNCNTLEHQEKGMYGCLSFLTPEIAAKYTLRNYACRKHCCCGIINCSCGGYLSCEYHCCDLSKTLPDWFLALPEDEPEREDKPATLYTLDIPGIQDIFRVPALESPQLRLQQIIRWKTHTSPLPEPLRWIPSVINFLDDCQDILVTALLASRWLLKRLPARLIPGVGWILTVNDALNLASALLATTQGGRSFKRATLKSLLWMFTRRGFRHFKTVEFLDKRFPWTSFIIQAAQVSQEWTGYGLQLGSLMGFVSEALWSQYRLIQGDEVVFRGPPPADPAGKAARVLMQMPMHAYMRDILTPEEHKMIITASCVALGTLQDASTPDVYAGRIDTVGELSYPLFEPWNEASQWALQQHGIAFRTNPDTGSLPYLPVDRPYPMIQDVLRPLTDVIPSWEDAMKEVMGPKSPAGTLYGYIHNVTWIDHLNWISSSIVQPPPPPQDPASRPRLFDYEDNLRPIPEDFEIDVTKAMEYSVFPTRTITPEELQLWLGTARGLSLSRGLNHASFEDLKTAAIQILGGFQRKTFVTYTGLR